MPGVSGVTVVTTTGVAAYPFLPARLRAHRAPGIPCALFFEGKEISSKPRAYRAARSRTCILPSLRGAKRRSNPLFLACWSMDCFANARNDGFRLFEMEPAATHGERAGNTLVMPGLEPGIHVLLFRGKDVDGRDKPGHDGKTQRALCRFHLHGLESLTSNFPNAPEMTKSL